VQLLVAGKYAAVEQMFNQQMKDALPITGLVAAVSPELKPMGAFEQTGKASAQKAGEYTVVIVPAYFEKGALDFTISFDGAWQIGGLYMKPGQKPKTTPAAAPATGPAAAQKPAQTPEERAREAVALLVAENYEGLFAMFTPDMQ
jgi:hypothetical protein